MPTNTPFLLCLSDMNRYKVYLNVKNVLVHKNKKYPIVRKWRHLWFLLENLEKSIVWCHMTETERRQLHRRLGQPVADRLYNALTRTGYDNLDHDTISKISKSCHQCQLHGGAPGRFTLHNDLEFNYRVIIDVIDINSKLILHVDGPIAFQAARFLKNMTAKCTCMQQLVSWIIL